MSIGPKGEIDKSYGKMMQNSRQSDSRCKCPEAGPGRVWPEWAVLRGHEVGELEEEQ